ncbi:hypothetical protein GA0070618_2010 [Micromonospora echinospora]|uniref:Uncharacterized protein n=1 Tax=Micromonospora echinospora TaxID=1877 RepID=A0A1C4WAH0_MICEC|nr:hypothetical protein GA0070618_2010 [Micromonospora echinospora]
MSVRCCPRGVIRSSRVHPPPPVIGRAADAVPPSAASRSRPTTTCPGGRGRGSFRNRVAAAGTGTMGWPTITPRPGPMSAGRPVRRGVPGRRAGGSRQGPGRRAGRGRRGPGCRPPVPTGRKTAVDGGSPSRPARRGTSGAAGPVTIVFRVRRVCRRAGTVVHLRTGRGWGRPGGRIRSGRWDVRRCPGRPVGSGPSRTGFRSGGLVRSRRSGSVGCRTGSRTGVLSRRPLPMNGTPRGSTSGTGRRLRGVVGGRTAASGGWSSPTPGSGSFPPR